MNTSSFCGSYRLSGLSSACPSLLARCMHFTFPLFKHGLLGVSDQRAQRTSSEHVGLGLRMTAGCHNLILLLLMCGLPCAVNRVEADSPRVPSLSLPSECSIGALVSSSSDLHCLKPVASLVKHVRGRRPLGSSGWNAWWKTTDFSIVANLPLVVENLCTGSKHFVSWKAITPLRC